MWHELSKKRFGYSIEIGIGNRREHRQLKGFTGELYTASPLILKGETVLCLWLDSFENVNPIFVTHELGHWIIKLQGFKALLNKPHIHSNEEIILNSMCQHPVVYNLQRVVGHDPQFEIDSRARNDIKFVRKDHPPYSENDADVILMLAEDVFHASNKISRDILKRAKRFHPNVYKKINLVNSILNKYDLLNPEEMLQCEFNIIEELNMGSNWVISEDVEKLEEMVACAQTDQHS